MNVTEQQSHERFSLLTGEAVLQLPTPDWLIEGVMPEKSLALLYGPPGEGKSFIAVDWALSIAAGFDWAGRRIKQGKVLYIAAEGGAGIKKRLSAWKKHNAVSELKDSFWLLEAPQLVGGSDLQHLLAALERGPKKVALTVIDTLSQSFFGKDENGSEMGLFVAAMKEIQKASEGAVLVVHHSAKHSQTPRGHTSLPGNVDVVMGVRKTQAFVELRNEKQKDEEAFGRMRFELRRIALEEGGTSAILIPAGGGDEGSSDKPLKPEAVKAALALWDNDPELEFPGFGGQSF